MSKVSNFPRSGEVSSASVSARPGQACRLTRNYADRVQPPRHKVTKKKQSLEVFRGSLGVFVSSWFQVLSAFIRVHQRRISLTQKHDSAALQQNHSKV